MILANVGALVVGNQYSVLIEVVRVHRAADELRFPVIIGERDTSAEDDVVRSRSGGDVRRAPAALLDVAETADVECSERRPKEFVLVREHHIASAKA